MTDERAATAQPMGRPRCTLGKERKGEWEGGKGDEGGRREEVVEEEEHGDGVVNCTKCCRQQVTIYGKSHRNQAPSPNIAEIKHATAWHISATHCKYASIATDRCDYTTPYISLRAASSIKEALPSRVLHVVASQREMTKTSVAKRPDRLLIS